MPERVNGFSLVEVLIATSVLAAVLVGVGHVSAMATRANHLARLSTQSAALAAGKMEELRAVPSMNLQPSPTGALSSNQAGYFDVIDATGRVLDESAWTPLNRAYVRRWAVTSIDSSLRVLEVLASPWPEVGETGDPSRPAGATYLVSVRGSRGE